AALGKSDSLTSSTSFRGGEDVNSSRTFLATQSHNPKIPQIPEHEGEYTLARSNMVKIKKLIYFPKKGN
ncbi:MAG: hypothetical protein LRY74_13190, partial [Shewanella xiamenensis]|nr:hypothetical protein [Shewanella xiamenensis]